MGKTRDPSRTQPPAGTYHTLPGPIGTRSILGAILRAIDGCIPPGATLELTTPFGARTKAFLRERAERRGSWLTGRDWVLPHDGHTATELAQAIDEGAGEREGCVYLYVRPGEEFLLEAEDSYDWLWLAEVLPPEVHRCVLHTVEALTAEPGPAAPPA